MKVKLILLPILSLLIHCKIISASESNQCGAEKVSSDENPSVSFTEIEEKTDSSFGKADVTEVDEYMSKVERFIAESVESNQIKSDIFQLKLIDATKLTKKDIVYDRLLDWAASNGQFNLIEYLLDNSAWKLTDIAFASLLAAENGHIEVFDLFATKGAILNLFKT